LAGIALYGGLSFNLWVLVLFLALNFGALSTYFDIFGIEGTLPNGESYKEETTLCWIMTGAGYGLAALPLLWCDVTLYSIYYRCITLAIAIPLIRKIPGAQIQEALSGLVYLATLRILG